MLKDGDSNSKFIQVFLKANRNQNSLAVFVDKEGKKHFSDSAKGKVAVKFFSELFQSSHPDGVDATLNDMPTRLSASMNTTLTKKVTCKEIHIVFFSVKCKSVLGHDGLTCLLFQNSEVLDDSET